MTLSADACVKNYCKRQFETSTYLWFPPEPRLGGESIVVEETPVLSYLLAGNITNGLPQITNISSTANLLVGMTAVQSPGVNNQTTQPFPNAATIVSIDSSSQVTMSGNATRTLTGVLWQFGFSVWFDPNGSFGSGVGTDPSGPYGPTSLLYPGIDYALQRDRPDGTAGAGKVIRLASAFGFLGMGGAWNPYGSTWGGLNQRGTLTAPLKPIWPNWPPGSIKILYAAGLGKGATPPNGTLSPTTTIPADLTAAVTLLAVYMWNNADTGMVQVTSESFQGFNRSIANIEAMDALRKDATLGSVRQLLSRYRKVAM